MEQMSFDFEKKVENARHERTAQEILFDECVAIYMKTYKGTSFGELEYARLAVKRILGFIEAKNYEHLIDLVGWTGNPASRRIFEHVTGIKLPNTNKESELIVQEFCKESYKAFCEKLEAEQKAKEDAERKAKQDKEDEMDRRLDGFLKGKPMMQRVNALDALTGGTRYRMSDGKVLTRQEAIRMWAAKGTLGVGTHEEDAVKFPRKRWNSMDWDEQNEWERRHMEAGKKTVYEVRNADENGYYRMGKTAYDYAVFMIEKTRQQQGA